MKQLFTVIAVLIFTASTWAQAPEKMSYQAVIRTPANTLLTNQLVGMQISILQGSIAGGAVYIETQTPTTNINGLVSIEIGTGTVLFGSITAIDWTNGPYFIKTETDPNGGSLYTISGTSELLSVPYALHAKTAENITGGIIETDPIFGASVANGITGGDTAYWNNHFSGDYNDLNNTPINVSSFTNDVGYLTSFTEVDGSITNEIQVLSISNDTIYLSNGGFVKIPASNAWLLLGNAGTVDGTNFIGTTDNVPLNFRVNNEKAGRIDQITGNTFYGYQSGKITTGDKNVGLGFQSLKNNTTGYQNVAIGYNTLMDNTTGTTNTAIGTFSLEKNTTGIGNTALGYAVMPENIGGGFNTAAGYDALFYNTTGSSNSAYGSCAMHFHTTGSWNIAFGQSSLMNNTTGNNNVAIGFESGLNNSLGSGNVFLGYRAGYNEGGSNKLYIANSSTNPPLIYGDFATGNVGIGMFPISSANLSIKTNAANGIQVTNGTGSSIHLNANTGSPGNPYMYFTDGTTSTLFNQLPSGNFTIGTYGGGPFQFEMEPNSTGQGIYVKSNGNVGIGTSSPAEKLDVRGNAIFGASNSINIWEWDFVEKLGIDYNPANGDFNMRNPVAGKRLLGTISPTGSWGIETTAGTEMVRITGAGNMGIGTTNPSAKLHIGNGTRFVASTDASIFLQSGNGAGSARDWKIYVPMTAGYLAFRDMGFDNLNNGMASDAMAIQWGTGNIGIGTTTPNTRLQVYGNSGNLLKLQTSNIMNTAGQSIGITFTTSADTETGRIEAITESNGNIGMRFYTYSGGANERLRISSAGNVGIGTSSPTSKLQVVGLPVYANNAAAIAGGLTIGAFYRTGADPDPVCVVH